MANNVHAIGTVVAVGDRRYVIVGHRMTRDDEQVSLGYALVPYPLGFVDMNSLSVVPASRVAEAVAEGYVNEAGAAHLASLDELAQASEGIAFSEYEESMRLLQDFVREEGAHA